MGYEDILLWKHFNSAQLNHRSARGEKKKKKITEEVAALSAYIRP